MKMQAFLDKVHDALVTTVVGAFKLLKFLYDIIPAAPTPTCTCETCPTHGKSDTRSNSTSYNPATGLPMTGAGTDSSGNIFGSGSR